MLYRELTENDGFTRFHIRQIEDYEQRMYNNKAIISCKATQNHMEDLIFSWDYQMFHRDEAEKSVEMCQG